MMGFDIEVIENYEKALKRIDMKAEEFITQEGRDNIRWIDAGELKELLDKYANQRVIEELEAQMELAQVGNSYTRLRDRIEELKQE